MVIDVIGSAREIEPNKVDGAVAVVIDVLRATSVMVTAFKNGVDKIIAVSSPEEAFDIKNKNPDYLLGGEKEALFIPGFDFDNSTHSYLPEKVRGKTVVMSTSNGTRAINGSLNAKRLLIGCFLNAKSVVDALVDAEKVVFVCSGSNNSFTLEDSVCAGYMIGLLARKHSKAQLSDYAIAMMELYHAHHDNLKQLVKKGNHYQTLVLKGFQSDLDKCFSHDTIDLVPELIDGKIGLVK